MSNTKHTPGPWKVVNGQYPNGYFLETVVTDEESKANGRLIASAPSLLEALKEMVERFDGVESKFSGDSYAINKAKELIQQIENQ